MNFDFEKSIEILERTPDVLDVLLNGLSEDWLFYNEGGDTWNVYDVIGHLLHGEKTDWIPRLELILSEHTDKSFAPFDRFAQMTSDNSKSFVQLLEEFKAFRMENIRKLKSKKIIVADLNATGIHPVFGEVTLAQLLATWTVHDLNHIAQISRIMAYQYRTAVGPWSAYLRILQ